MPELSYGECLRIGWFLLWRGSVLSFLVFALGAIVLEFVVTVFGPLRKRTLPQNHKEQRGLKIGSATHPIGHQGGRFVTYRSDGNHLFPKHLFREHLRYRTKALQISGLTTHGSGGVF